VFILDIPHQTLIGIWDALLTNEGLTVEKLVEWKKKSYFLMGKAEYAMKNYERAVGERNHCDLVFHWSHTLYH
jgi:hypothetical protein